MTSYEYWKNVYEGIDIPAIIFGCILAYLALVLAKWHKADGPFDFRQTLLDSDKAGISLYRLGQMTALVSSTGLLFYLAVKNRMTDWMYLGYMTAWCGTYLAAKATELKYGAIQPAGPPGNPQSPPPTQPLKDR